MKALLSTLCLVIFAPSLLWAEAVRPKSPVDCVAMAVAKEMKVLIQEENQIPKVFYASETSLSDFQNAVEPQWGMKPDVFLNVYVVAQNAIYLIDDASYYTPKARFIDDSLAHELVHYFQVVYKASNVPEDYFEDEAVFLQTWYRQTFMEQGQDPCSY